MNDDRVRKPAVAGKFYPSDAGQLARDVDRYLAENPSAPSAGLPKAMILPHAGYAYSGPIAASGYSIFRGVHSTINRVVLIGPAHRVGFEGVAVSGLDRFDTPLGAVPLDRPAIDRILKFPQVVERDDAHELEHSLEVHLPFLQRVFETFRLIPLVVGDVIVDELVEVMDFLWGGDETLIVVSSDLSHFHDYAVAKALDEETSRLIVSNEIGELDSERACGRTPIQGLMRLARTRGLSGEILDLRNSGDTAGPRDRVVGYGAYAFG